MFLTISVLISLRVYHSPVPSDCQRSRSRASIVYKSAESALTTVGLFGITVYDYIASLGRFPKYSMIFEYKIYLSIYNDT